MNAGESGNVDLAIQERRLLERKARLVDEARAARAQAQSLMTGQVVKGGPGFTDIYVGAPKGSAYLPIAQQIGQEYQQKLLSDKTDAHEKLVAAAALRHLQDMPKDSPETPATLGAYGVNIPGKPAVAVTPEQRLAWAQEGSQIPGLKPVMDAYTADLLVKEPERQEARAERRQTKLETLAESQRKQRDELEYRRDRDAQAEQLRRDLSAAIAARGSGAGGGGGRGGSASTGGTWGRDGVKAADIIRDTDEQGNITLTDKISGEQKFFKGGGREAAAFTKDKMDAKQNIDNAEKALDLLDEMHGLIPKATSSGVGAVRDKALGIVGASTKAGDAAGELDQMGKKLVSYIDRKGLGPQFSDADLKFLSATSGGLGDPTIPVSRKLAVYERVRRQFEAQAKGTVPAQTPKAVDDVNRRQSIRDAVKSSQPVKSGGWTVEKE